MAFISSVLANILYTLKDSASVEQKKNKTLVHQQGAGEDQLASILFFIRKKSASHPTVQHQRFQMKRYDIQHFRESVLYHTTLLTQDLLYQGHKSCKLLVHKAFF